MKVFDISTDVPENFEGHCFVTGDKAEYWLKPGWILHYDDGPAVINGYTHDDRKTKKWFKEGRNHRIDGPAIEWRDGGKWYYLNDSRYQEEDFWKHPLVVQNTFKKILEI